MPKILIIEDDPKLEYLYRVAFEFQRYEVTIVETVKQALETIKRINPALIIIDEGCKDFGDLKKGDLDIPVFLLTNRTPKESASLSNDIGSSFWINPLDGSLGALIKEVAKVLS